MGETVTLNMAGLPGNLNNRSLVIANLHPSDQSDQNFCMSWYGYDPSVSE